MAAYNKKTAEVNYFLDLFVHLNNGSFGIFGDNAVQNNNIDTVIIELKSAIDELTAKQAEFNDAQKKHYEEILRIFAEIETILNENPQYGQIELISQSNTDYVRAAAFRDEFNDIYFTTRGTGDGRWVDNAVMMCEPESVMQEATREYFDDVMQNLEEPPEHIILTGHSKGGNDVENIMMRSEYIFSYALKNKDFPFTSYSMNGPGFSKAAIDEFREKCAENGVDPGIITENMHMIIGENDYVNWLGNRITPPKNIRVIKRKNDPANTGKIDAFPRYHALEYMQIHEYNFGIYDDDPLTDKSLGPLGKLAKVLHKLQMELEAPIYDMSLSEAERDDAIALYQATALSLMSALEAGAGGGRGLGNIEFATPEQFRLFFEKGLPFLLNGTGDVPGLKSDPELVREVFILFGCSDNLTAEQLMGVLDYIECVLKDTASWLPDNISADLMPDIIDAMTKKDWTALFTPAGIAMIISVLPAIQIALVKNTFESSVDQITQTVQTGISAITELQNAGVDFNAELTKGVYDATFEVIDKGIEAICCVNGFVLKFGAFFLAALKKTLGDPYAFDYIETTMQDIDSAMQKSADKAIKPLQSFRDNLKDIVDSAASESKEVIKGLESFLFEVTEKAAETVKSIVGVAFEIMGKTREAVKGFAWDAYNFCADVGGALISAGKEMVGYIEENPKEFAIAAGSAAAALALFSPIKFAFGFPTLTPPIVPALLTAAVASTFASNSKVLVDLRGLLQLQKSIADLLSVWQNAFGVTKDAYNTANSASLQYQQTYVQNAANEVRTLCGRIAANQNAAYMDLAKINEGLLQTIAGYGTLEAGFN